MPYNYYTAFIEQDPTGPLYSLGNIMEKNDRKDARLVARVSTDIQSTIHKAATYSGATVTQFLVESALDKAKAVINEIESIHLTNEASLRMMELLSNPPEPSAFLTKAKANYKSNIRNAKNQPVEQAP